MTIDDDQFHLEKISDGKWNFYEYALSPVLTHEKFQRQPGEPTHSTWTYVQESKEQPLQFRLHVSGKSGSINNIKMLVDNYAEINLPIELKAGESIVCDGTENIQIYDEQGKPKGNYHLTNMLPVTSKATHTIIFDCSFNDGESPKVEMQFKDLGKKKMVEIKK